MATEAITGMGATFEIGTAVETPVYTPVAEVVSITPPNRSRGTIDATHLGSEGGYGEFINGLRDGGEVTITVNHTEAGLAALEAAYDSDVNLPYRITYPNGATWEFTGPCTALEAGEIVADDKITDSATFKVSGAPTFTAAP